MGIPIDRDRFCTLTAMTGHEAGIDSHGTRMASEAARSAAHIFSQAIRTC